MRYERKMLRQISGTRAKSAAYIKAAKKDKKEKSGKRSVGFTLKSVMYTILAVSYIKRQYRDRKDLFEDSEIECYRRRRKGMKGRSVRMLMKLPKQDPLSWITIPPSKTGDQQKIFNQSNFAPLHP